MSEWHPASCSSIGRSEVGRCAPEWTRASPLDLIRRDSKTHTSSILARETGAGGIWERAGSRLENQE